MVCKFQNIVHINHQNYTGLRISDAYFFYFLRFDFKSVLGDTLYINQTSGVQTVMN